jgi:5-methylthioribose kinase
LPESNLPDYERLDETSLRRWLSELPSIAQFLGGRAHEWSIREVGDGNLNMVFLVVGPNGGVCVKQSLPYVRVVGPGWPMPLERAFYEQLHYRTTGSHVSGLAPRLQHYDPKMFAMVLELLPDHRILRQLLINGERVPAAVRQVAEYVARSTFATSVLARPFEIINPLLAAFSRNEALTRVTVDLIFTHPYMEHERNRWTSPALDDLVGSLRADSELKVAIARMGYAFLTRHEALLHGDLHTGSVMANAADTRIIDAEFALYGPVGFDLGLFVGNLLMAYFSQPGHPGLASERASFGEWILGQIIEFWNSFVSRLSLLLSTDSPGDGYPAALFSSAADVAALAAERERWFHGLFRDTLGFAGAEIVRRIIGFAHNADFESIADPATRANLERRALLLARRLLVEPELFASVEALVAAARAQALGN